MGGARALREADSVQATGLLGGSWNLVTTPSPPRTYYLGTGALLGALKGLLFGYLEARVL